MLARIISWYYRTYLDKQRLKTAVKFAVTDDEAVTFGQKFISGGSIFSSPLQQTLSSAPGLGFARRALLVKALQIELEYLKNDLPNTPVDPQKLKILDWLRQVWF